MFSTMSKMFSKRKQNADFGKPQQKKTLINRNYESFFAKWATISSMSMFFKSESFRLIS